ncbi:MAG: hypothetical protein ACRCT1_20935 [Microcoleaceae cyanobacterium]
MLVGVSNRYSALCGSAIAPLLRNRVSGEMWFEGKISEKKPGFFEGKKARSRLS